jgi:PAS domain S-box-containing protein
MPLFAPESPQLSVSVLPREALVGLLQGAPDLIRIADEQGVVRYAAGATRELLGCAPEDIEGHSVTEANHPNDVDVLAAASREALATGRSTRRIHRAKHCGGGYRWLETSVRVLNTARGRFAVLVSRETSARTVGRSQVTRFETNRPGSVDEWEMPNGSEAGDLARHLTDRERQVLRGLGDGMSVCVLAQRYHLHESTLRGHVKAILQKLQVHSQLQAVLVGMRAGILSEGDRRALPGHGSAQRTDHLETQSDGRRHNGSRDGIL